LQNFALPVRRIRNLPLGIGILQDTVWDCTSKRVLDQDAIRHELGHMSGIRPRAGTRAGFELDGDQAFGGLDQVVRAAREPETV